MDLVRSLVDLRPLGVAHEPLHGIVPAVARATIDLHRIGRDAHGGVRGVPLGHAAGRCNLLARVAHPRRAPGEEAGRFDGDRHLGQHPLDQLLVADRPPELRALEGVVARVLQRAARQADASGGDADPARAKGRQGDLEPLPLVPEPVLGGNPGFLEDQLVAGRGPNAHLSFLRPEPEALRLALDHERRDPVLAPAAVDRGEDHEDPGIAAVRDPDLRSAEPVVVAVPNGAE